MNANAFPTAPLWTRVRAMFARAVAAIGDAAAIARLTALAPALRRRIVAWLAPLEHIVRKLLLAEAAALHTAAHRKRIEVVPFHHRQQAQRPSPRGAETRSLEVGAIALQSQRLREGGGVILAASVQSPRTAQAKATPHDRAQTPRTALHPTPNPLPSTGRGRSLIDPSRPETWPATFSLAPPRDPRAVPESRAPRIRALWGPPPPPPPPKRPPRAVKQEDAPFRLARRFEALRRVLENPLPHARRLARLLVRALRRFPEIARRYLMAPARTRDYDSADPRLSLDAMTAAFDAQFVFVDSS